MFGDGGIQGRPVSSYHISRFQPRSGTIERRPWISALCMRAISPAVMPWRTGTAK